MSLFKKTPTQILNEITKKIETLRKKPVNVQIKHNDALIDLPSDYVPFDRHIKDQLVKNIVGIKRDEVAQNEERRDYILALIDEAYKKIAVNAGTEFEKMDAGLDWFSLDDLLRVRYTCSQYAVPNDNLGFAEKEFNKMMETHNYELEDPLVKLAKLAFKKTKSGRVNIQAIQNLRKANFKHAEWQRIKELLATCYDYHDRKMSLTVSQRESLKHNWELITDK